METLTLVADYIELSKKGWWKRAVDNIVLDYMWRAREFKDKEELVDLVSNQISIKKELVLQTIDRLVNNGSVYINNNKLILNNNVISKYNDLFDRYKNIEKEAKLFFINILKDNEIVYYKNLWAQLINTIFTHIKNVGSSFIPFFKNYDISISNTCFKNYLDKFFSDNKAKGVLALKQFLTSNNKAVNDFILRIFYAVQALNAAQLSKNVINTIVGMYDKTLSFNIFLDTNALYSLLDIHKHQDNQLIKSIHALKKSLPKRVALNYYVSPITVDEARKRILTERYNWINNYDISGIGQRYVEKCRHDGLSNKPYEYFTFLHNNLPSLITNEKITIMSDYIDSYTNDERIIRELERRQQLNTTVPHKTLMHDVILWYYVFDKRPRISPNIFDVKWWILTLSPRSINNDIKLAKDKQLDYPICLSPRELLKAVEFYVPRSEELENSFLELIASPVHFLDYKINESELQGYGTRELRNVYSPYELSERATIEIMQESHFANKIKNTNDRNKRYQLEVDKYNEIVKSYEKESLDKIKRLSRINKEMKNSLEDVQKKTIITSEKLESMKGDYNSKEEKYTNIKNALIDTLKERADTALARFKKAKNNIKRLVISLLVVTVIGPVLAALLTGEYIILLASLPGPLCYIIEFKLCNRYKKMYEEKRLDILKNNSIDKDKYRLIDLAEKYSDLFKKII